MDSKFGFSHTHTKKNSDKDDFKVGNIVTVLSTDTPPFHWPLGRITKIIFGSVLLNKDFFWTLFWRIILWENVILNSPKMNLKISRKLSLNLLCVTRLVCRIRAGRVCLWVAGTVWNTSTHSARIFFFYLLQQVWDAIQPCAYYTSFFFFKKRIFCLTLNKFES